MTVDYTYRPDGLRLSKRIGTVTTTHVWDGTHIVAERNATGGVINRFDRGANWRIIRSEHHGFYLYNVRGDVIQRTNATGAVTHSYRYTAFGNELSGTQSANTTSNNQFRFAGEYWDAHTQTYYLRARSFNPRTGRFTSPDPYWRTHNMQSSRAAIAQSANLFVFVMNNPVRFVDPTGLFALSSNSLKQAGLMLASSTSTNGPTTVTATTSFGDTIDITDVQNAMEAGADMLVFVGGMAVSGSSRRLPQHASIQIFIAPGHALWDTGHFRTIWDGIGHATIGGFTANRTFDGIRGALGEIGEPMDGLINDGFDIYYPALNSLTYLPGVTAAQVESMFSGAINFSIRGSVPYNPLANFATGGHNSNSFIAGLLTYAGIEHPSMSTSIFGGFPGWGNPIPTHHFRLRVQDPRGIIGSL